MKQFFRKHVLTIVGIPIGAIGGYAYFHFWGCTDSCPIRSSAGTMMIYGAAMGGLLFSFISDRFIRK